MGLHVAIYIFCCFITAYYMYCVLKELKDWTVTLGAEHSYICGAHPCSDVKLGQLLQMATEITLAASVVLFPKESC